jgi:CRP-like cAMP-binding protein
LGELAFLDGNPRSASAEALGECELVEISSDVFTKTVAILPDWIKVLLKTVVGRLRTASTRIRQMESASTEINYSAKGGKRIAVYISTPDMLKIATAILLVGSRSSEKTDQGQKIRISLLQRYAHNVMSVPISKITSLVDALTQVGILKVEGAAHEEVTLLDPTFLEEYIGFLCEQSVTEPERRKDVSLKGFIVMNFIVKHLDEYPVNAETGLAEVNLGAILKTEREGLPKDPFKIEDANELITIGMLTTPAAKDADNVFTSLKPEPMKKLFSFQRVIKAIETLNAQKSQNQSRS